MKLIKLTLSIIAVLCVSPFLAKNAFATTWYVRDGGGTETQCTGKTNAVYPGSGSSQACAFNNPRYATGWDSDNPQPGTMVGGDTLYIDGDSDINPGQQAQYLIGYDNTGANTTPDCSSSWSYDCVLTNLPAGVSTSQPTSVIGTGSHKPQLWGNQRVWQVLSADNNYITLQWLEITDHEACEYNGPGSAACNYGGPYPYGAWAEDGIYIGGTGLTLSDVYVHGLGRYGVNTDNLGNVTFTRVYVIGNGFGGVSTGINATMSGTLTWNQPIIEWNGCVEAYPVTSIDNPSNYSQCFGQNSGGYGDGLAFGNTGHGSAGNWTIIGPGSISFNTQDGLDTLHGNGTGTIQIDKMRFEGNAGNQVKMNAVNAYLTNSIVIGDCGWWYGAKQSYSGFTYGDICRALGDAVLFNVTNNSVAKIYNNTIVSNGNIALESEDLNSTGCNASTEIYAKNNIVVGGYAWFDDTAFNAAGGNTQTTYTYNDGNNGDGGGTCGSLTWNEDYNIVDGTKNNNQGCNGANDKCGTNPAFATVIPLGTAGGLSNTYYQGNVGETLVSLGSSSPALASGITGLSYWNSENDYHNVARTNPPSIGGLESDSCAVNEYGCLYNSDCCSETCSNFVCGAKQQPTVSITSPSNGNSFLVNANVTVTVNASETNGTITDVSLYNGSLLLGSSSKSPYSFVVVDVPLGTYVLTAKATDANNTVATSSPITLTVTPLPVLPSLPVVNITSPGNGSAFSAGSNVTITTTASETNGTIKNISLYHGAGVLLASSATSPFNYVYSNLMAGSYTFYAVATDILGVSTTSSSVTVTATAPAVSITSPTNGSSYSTGSNITITANASETGGTVAEVYFYNGSTLLGSDSTSPYSYTASGIPAGTYTLTAKATDTKGVSTTSSPVTVTVAAPPSPVVTLTSPVNGSSFPQGSYIGFTTNATETNGKITQVQYFNGTTLIGGGLTSPYIFGLANVAAGKYTFTAKAMDANGVVVASSPVTVTVVAGSPPQPVVALTSPANNSTVTAGSTINLTTSATEANGRITQVQYFSGTTLIGGGLTSPYTFGWANVPVGSYTFTAKATDANGVVVASSPVKVTVIGPPVVALTSPVNGSSLPQGSYIGFTTNATETNGKITQVQYFNGTTLIGGGLTSPYIFGLANVAAGKYTFTAKAMDANGVVVASSPVTVTVVAGSPPQPVVALTSPANNSTVTAGSTINLTTSATETNGRITQVQYFSGTTLIGGGLTSPYTFGWANVPVGSYTFTAKATDANGIVVASSPVTVSVVAGTLPQPVVTLTSPANNSTFTEGATINLTTSATETNGKITQVQYFSGTTLIGGGLASPYIFGLANVSAGKYTFTAKATDANGVVVASSPVTVTVTTSS